METSRRTAADASAVAALHFAAADAVAAVAQMRLPLYCLLAFALACIFWWNLLILVPHEFLRVSFWCTNSVPEHLAVCICLGLCAVLCVFSLYCWRMCFHLGKFASAHVAGIVFVVCAPAFLSAGGLGMHNGCPRAYVFPFLQVCMLQ